MILSKPPVISGQGESILQDIAAASEHWNSNRNLYDELVGEVEQLAEAGKVFLERVLNDCISRGDVSHIADAVDLLSNPEQSMVLQAELGSTALKWLTDMRYGDRIGSAFVADGHKSRVTITEPGVEIFTPSQGWRILTADHVGKSYNGKLLGIETAPYAGGVIDLGKSWTSYKLLGIVDPSTSQPRVELSIFGHKS